MILNFLIVDDEIHVCRLLAKFVRDLYPNADISMAHTGKSAYALICEKNPDIVITDIRIPEMDGIDLVKQCWESGIRSKFVIVSGYRKFEYAHNALKYGVVNYLLKPIQTDELKKVLKGIEDTIRVENDMQVHEDVMLSQIVEYKQQIRSKALTDLLEGRTVTELPETDFDFFVVIVTKLSFSRGMRGNIVFHRMIMDNLRSICNAYFPNTSGTFADVLPYRENILFLIGCSEKEGLSLKGKIGELSTAVLRWTAQYSEFKASLGISRIFHMIRELHTAAEEAWFCSFSHILYGFGRSFRADSAAPEYKLPAEEADRIRAKFRKLAESGDLAGIRFFLNLEFRHAAENRFLHPYALYDLYLQLIEELNVYRRSLSLPDMKDLEPDGENELTDSLSMFIHTTTEEICRYIRQIEEQKKDVDEMPVALAKQYISGHIREDISLDTVAEKVHLSPTYFSMLFKKDTGMNFIDYVIWARMETAKKLLSESQLPVSDIAEAVGYQDIRSFSKRFKKEIGITPTRFRKYHLDSKVDWWTQ